MLSAAVQKATENFILRGEEIANENPEIRSDMLAALDDVRITGDLFDVFVRSSGLYLSILLAKVGIIRSVVHFTNDSVKMYRYSSLFCGSICIY